MSRRVLLPLLALLAVLVPGAIVASGCGAEDAAGVDVAKAASATGAKGTAKVDLELKMSGLGLPGTMEVEGSGVTALDEPRMDLTLDLGPMVAAFGVPAGDAEVRVKVDGSKLYVDPPAMPGLELPGGATWAALDLRKAADALGFDTKALGAAFQVDPAAQLRALRAASDLEEVGKEDVAGAETTHLRGKLRIKDLLATLPAEQRAEAEKAMKQLEGHEALLDRPMPYDIWVDDESVVRRMVQETEVPGQKGVPGGKVRIELELSDFGAKLDTSAPPADETYEATEPLLEVLEQLQGAGGSFMLG